MSDQSPHTSPLPLEAHLGFWLRFVSNHVSTHFQQLLENAGVTVAEWVALRTLWEREEKTRAELIDALDMTNSAALADASDAHFFGHLPESERKTLACALQALVQYHQLKETPGA